MNFGAFCDAPKPPPAAIPPSTQCGMRYSKLTLHAVQLGRKATLETAGHYG